MNRLLRTACLVCLFAVPAFAQDFAPAPPPPSAEVSAPVAPAPNPVVKDTSVSVQLAANIGLLSVDLQVGHFYAFAAGNVGVPLLTDGRYGAFAAGAGFTFALSQPNESMWFMDMLAILNPGWMNGQPFLGVGAGLGLRYLHRSGFTMGFKLPLLGGAIGANGGSGGTAAAVGYFFLANLVSLPVISLGYRF